MTIDTAKLRELLVKATPGAWESYPQEGPPTHCYVAQLFRPDGRDSIAEFCPTQDESEATANVELCRIVHNALPTLLDELDALRELGEAAAALQFSAYPAHGSGFVEIVSEPVRGRFAKALAAYRKGSEG